MTILTLMLVLIVGTYTIRFGGAGLSRLAQSSWRASWCAVVGLTAQVVGFSFPASRFGLLAVSTVLLFSFCWLNRVHRGMALVAIGVALNMTVMLANGATMPIDPHALYAMSGVDVPTHTLIEGSKDRVIPDEQAAFAWLGDRLLLPGPLASLAVWSIGDVALIVGMMRLLWYVMKGEQDDSTPYGTATTAP